MPSRAGRFARTIDSLDSIFAFIAEFLREHRLDSGHAFDLDLIAEELFTNMVKYGGGEAEVELRLAREGDIVTLVFRDFDGRPYDVTAARALPPRPDTARLADESFGGRGLHLVQRLADGLEYHHDGQVGTTTVRKRLAP